MKSSLLIWTVCALIVAACIVLVLYGCQTVTVQIGPDASADHPSGIKTEATVGAKSKEEKK